MALQMHMPDEVQPSVVHRQGRPTAADYDEAIEELQRARAQLAPDGNGCNVCGDSGHQAFECHHNPLLLARRWTAARSIYTCWHCGYTATNEDEAVAHFGTSDAEVARCIEQRAEAVR